MNIIKNLVDPSMYRIKCPYTMNPECIVVHNTANDASARNEVAYMRRNTNYVSFHYAIDDKEVVQGIPENRNAWHAGDGKYGKGNRKGIAIEICFSRSGGVKFANAERLAIEFIAKKLFEKGWGVDKVKKHQDFSNKYCPHRTLNLGWGRFLDAVEEELNALKKETHEEDKKLEAERILKEIMDYPDGWIAYIEDQKDDPVGQYLPDFILKLYNYKK